MSSTLDDNSILSVKSKYGCVCRWVAIIDITLSTMACSNKNYYNIYRDTIKTVISGNG